MIKKFLLLFFLFIPINLSANSLFKAYYSFDRYPSTTIQNSTKLPLGMDSFGFIDINGIENSGEFTNYFIEHRIGKEIINGIGVQGEYNDIQGNNNDIFRAGVTYNKDFGKHLIKLRVFPYETDRDGYQISLLNNIQLSKLFSLFSFVDYDKGYSNNSFVVFESELSLKFNEKFSLYSEYRYNEYNSKSNDILFGLGIPI